MREFQDKKRVRKFLYSKGVVAVLAVFVLILAHATWGVYQKEQESQTAAAASESELGKLQDRQAVLQSEIARLKTDEGVEEEIRSKFSVAKPGEDLIIIVNPDDATNTQTLPKPSLWDRVKGWLTFK